MVEPCERGCSARERSLPKRARGIEAEKPAAAAWSSDGTYATACWKPAWLSVRGATVVRDNDSSAEATHLALMGSLAPQTAVQWTCSASLRPACFSAAGNERLSDFPQLLARNHEPPHARPCVRIDGISLNHSGSDSNGGRNTAAFFFSVVYSNR